MDNNKDKVNFNFIALKTKGYKRILIQKESMTILTVSIATTIIMTGTVLIVTSNTRNIKVSYCMYCYKSYYTKEKCWMLYPHLKQQANAGKERRRLSSKKRKIYKDNNELNKPIGLITYFGMTANNDINNLLYT